MLKNGLKIGAFVLAVGLMAAVAAPPKSTDSAEVAAVSSQPVKALKVESITVVPRHTTYGQTRSDRTWAAVSRIDGRVAWVSPKLLKGETVEAGEELIRIDNKPFQRAVDRLKSEIKNLDAAIKTGADDKAKARRLNGLKALLVKAEENLEATSVKAPFRGRVDEVNIASGQALEAGLTMLTMESTAKGEITIALSPDKVAMITGGRARAEELSQAKITVEVEDEEAREARPRAAAVNPGTGLVEASVEVADPPPSGTLCKVTISGRPQAGQVVIPRQAVRDGEVLLLDAQSRLTRRTVTVKYTLDQYAVIGEGLRPGETLVLSDPAKLENSRKLEIRLDGNFYLTAKTDLSRENKADISG